MTRDEQIMAWNEAKKTLDAAKAVEMEMRKAIVAANFDAVRIHHPRFAEWRNRWSHLIECRQLSVKDPLDAPSVIWSERWVMQRVDVERVRGVASSDAQNGIAWREKLREWITSRSKTGFPTTILGL